MELFVITKCNLHFKFTLNIMGFVGKVQSPKHDVTKIKWFHTSFPAHSSIKKCSNTFSHSIYSLVIREIIGKAYILDKYDSHILHH